MSGAHPGFAEAARVWARIGFLSFGGPAGQIALMHRILVDERRWISEARFLHALNYCMLLPGPEAQQLATYVGWLLHGWRGGVVAGTLFVVPGFLVILGLATLYVHFLGTGWFASLFFGLKCAVLAIVLQALWRIGRRALKTSLTRVLAAAAFVGIFVLDAPFPAIVLGAGVIGLVAARFAPGLLGVKAAHGGTEEEAATNGLHGVEPSLGRAARIIALCGGLWLAPILLLLAIFGPASVYPDIAAFFSRMAVVTFGGAYAVLAYVAQQAVETYHWLEPGEMVDGLALAETTPGPLILVLVFVGYLAAFRDAAGLDPFAAAFIGATLTTWVTFVPCFLWIFLGAPYVERLRANRALSGALSAITAAVVGVILNLALWFGLHVVFGTVGRLEAGPLSMPWPDWPTLDALALVLSGLAAVAVFRFHAGILPLLAGAGLVGLAAGFV